MVARRQSLPFSVERVKLDRQGYNSRGQYFGVGAPVFRLDHNETGEMRHVRAASRAAAIAAGKRLWGVSNPSVNFGSLSKDIRSLTTELKRARARKSKKRR